MSERDFYDRCYDAWREGRNPDMVSWDTYDMLRASGAEEQDITWRDCYPNHGRPQEPDIDEDEYAARAHDAGREEP